MSCSQLATDIEAKLDKAITQLSNMGQTECMEACVILKAVKKLMISQKVQDKVGNTIESERLDEMVKDAVQYLLTKASDELKTYFPPEMFKMLEVGLAFSSAESSPALQPTPSRNLT